jgi:hypothetical protein
MKEHHVKKCGVVTRSQVPQCSSFIKREISNINHKEAPSSPQFYFILSIKFEPISGVETFPKAVSRLQTCRGTAPTPHNKL